MRASGWAAIGFGLVAIVWSAFYLPFDTWEWFSLGTVGVVLFIMALASRQTGQKLRRPLFRERMPTEPGVTDNHGHARWATTKEMRETFDGERGLVVGEAYRVDQDSVAEIQFDPSDRKTWGSGGRMPLLIDSCTVGSTHSMIFGGSGRYKTTSAVSTILNWPWQAFVLDPSCELGPMLEETLVANGKKVYQLGIGDRGMNVLDWIDTSHPEAESWVKSAVDWFYDDGAAQSDAKNHTSKDASFWIQWGKSLTVCILAHLMWSEDDIPKTLATLRKGISTPERKMPGLLQGIHAGSRSPMARDIAAGLMDMQAPQTFSGIYSNAFAGTAWLSIAAYADLVSGDGFRTTDLLRDGMTLFVQIPLRTLRSTPAIGRAIIGCLLNTVYMADPQAMNGRVLGLIDEARRLGAMSALAEASDTGRKYGLTLQLLYQSEAQLEEVWGVSGAQVWRENCSWIGYTAVQDHKIAAALSASLGTHGVMAYSDSSNRGMQNKGGGMFGSRSWGTNSSTHEIKRPLIYPHEIMQLRDDEMIVRTRNCRYPIRCGRAIYFRRPELVKQVAQSRFSRQVA